MSKAAKVKPPVFKYDGGFLMEFRYSNEQIEGNTNDKILHFIGNEETIITAELAEKISLSQITIKRALKCLQNSDELRRDGGDKGGRWVLIKAFNY